MDKRSRLVRRVEIELVKTTRPDPVVALESAGLYFVVTFDKFSLIVRAFRYDCVEPSKIEWSLSVPTDNILWVKEVYM